MTAGAKELFSKMPVVCMCKLATHPKCSLHEAAPEMLEALKHIKNTLGPTPGCSEMTCEGCRAEIEEVLDTTTRIIAKAEGRIV